MVCVFENGVLRGIFGPEREEVTGGWRKLHNEELHNLYFIRYYHGDQTQKDGMGGTRSTHRRYEKWIYNLIKNSAGKRLLGRCKQRCEDHIIKMRPMSNTQHVRMRPQDRIHRRSLVNAVGCCACKWLVIAVTVNIVTGYGPEDRGSIRGRARDFSLRFRSQTVSGRDQPSGYREHVHRG
jgi:hypothetical protein